MRLRVCTFNIHHGVGTDGRLDLGRIADVLAATGATLIGLQEVDRTLSPRSAWIDQAAWLGERLDMEVVHGATIDRDPQAGAPPETPRRRYGNALLSAHPVRTWHDLAPARQRPVARRGGLVDATVDADGTEVRVLVTHLQNRSARERREQAAHLRSVVSGDGRATPPPRPTILLGDMNAGPDSPEMRLLATVLVDAWAAVGIGPGRTFPAGRPIARIDHVLVSADLRPLTADVPDTRASDHRPVVVEVEIDAEAAADLPPTTARGLSCADLVRPRALRRGTLVAVAQHTRPTRRPPSRRPSTARPPTSRPRWRTSARPRPTSASSTSSCARPAEGERDVLAVGELHPDHGLVGDNWGQRRSRRTEDGSAHPDMQLNVINARLSTFVAVDPERRALAGDQLHLDLDLSAANLPPGTRLALGSAVIEITEIPHTGCAKFVARFGKDAMRFVNSPLGRELRLRGLNAKVVVAGTVRPGDEVRKIPA